jgi:hypothetical protein
MTTITMSVILLMNAINKAYARWLVPIFISNTLLRTKQVNP